MKPIKNATPLILAFLGVVFIQTAINVELLSAEPVIVIANKNVDQSQLTEQEVKDIFLGDKTTWSNGRHVVVVTLKSGAVHDEFLEAYVKKQAVTFSRYWKRLLMTGKSSIPISFETENELLDYVAKTDGAIGYISPALFNDTVKKVPVN